MMQESGGRNIPQQIVDINTRKGTPAFGPMQMIEPTFRAHAMPGYTDWRNPLHNTIAAIRYIQSRYGSPYNLPRGG
jgi:SLT domain-containing protein